MGIIRQQTIKGTFYSYIGAAVGFVSLVIVAPRVFTTDQIGLTQVMVAVATIIAQFGGLGFGNVTNRLFPYFRGERKDHNGYLTLALLVTSLGFIMAYIFLRLYLPRFVELNSEKSELLARYAYMIPTLIGLLMLFNILDNFCKVLFNAIIGIFLKEVVLRLLNLMLIVLFFLNIVDFEGYVLLYVLSFGVPVVFITIYLLYKGEIRFGRIGGVLKGDFLKQMLSLCFFGIVSGLSGIALTNIDKYMVNIYTGLGSAGVYAIAVYFATLILIPARSLGKISVPVIAEAWKREDLKEIQQVYYKSSINQYIIGLLLLLGIIVNLDNIFLILPEDYRDGRTVIIIFGLANLFKVTAGVSQYILATSSIYRYQTYIMILLVVMVIVTNIIFIPIMGLTGAAIASLISIVITTGVNVVILKGKFELWPYGKQHIILTIIGVAVLLLTSLIPQMKLLTDIVCRSLLISVLYILLIRFFQISEEANAIYNEAYNYIKRKFTFRHK